jgi:protein TonB
MKNLLLLAVFLISGMSFAQDGVSVSGNTVSMREIPPTWPGCTGSELKKKNCFNQKLAQHIGKNFKFPKEYKAEDKGSKVIVTFVINEEGKPEVKEVTGGKPYLQAEAKRNILQIPEMEPGMLGGKPRAIQYKVPFNF